ncbi:hypothetical protein ANCDUO_11554 [Ancylostoma duodenale]|uniref:Tetraspanin family protein n=1 Tax=Ancylostoma duodenale TaxID=51022 RepID=A0A0C2GMG4_9BILA|nr:hypothetical protein ANCDUO_11554 [Ancylostoma duodenale]
MLTPFKCGYDFIQKALQSLNVFYVYMIILSCVFVIQFIVAIVCLGNVSEASLQELVTSGWAASDQAVKLDAQKAFGCCGLDFADMQKQDCRKVLLPCWNQCEPCLPVIVSVTSNNLVRVGLLGLFFSFSEADCSVSARTGMKPSGSARKKSAFGGGIADSVHVTVKPWEQCSLFRDHNPPYSKRIVELRNLPEEYWTPVLKKLKEDGVMPDLTRTDGCRI